MSFVRFALTVALTTCARAAEAACPLQTIPPACKLEWIDLDALARMLCIELAHNATTTVSFARTSCTEAMHLEVEVEVPTSTITHLDIPLGDVSYDMRPRTAALVILEHLPPAPPPPPKIAALRRAPPPANPSAAPPDHAAPGNTAIFASGLARYLASSGTMLFGARGGVELPLLDLQPFELLLRIDALAAAASVLHALGEVSLGFAGAGGALMLRRDGRVHLAAGPRLELIYVWASGRAFDTTTIMRSGSGTALLASANGSASISIGGSWRTFLEVELGAPLRSFDARADRDALGIEGFFAGAALGASYAF